MLTIGYYKPIRGFVGISTNALVADNLKNWITNWRALTERFNSPLAEMWVLHIELADLLCRPGTGKEIEHELKVPLQESNKFHVLHTAN